MCLCGSVFEMERERDREGVRVRARARETNREMTNELCFKVMYL